MYRSLEAAMAAETASPVYRPPEAIIIFPDEIAAWEGLAVADQLLPMADPNQMKSPTIRFDLEPPALKPLTNPGPPEIRFEGVGRTYFKELIQALADSPIPHQVKSWKYQDYEAEVDSVPLT